MGLDRNLKLMPSTVSGSYGTEAEMVFLLLSVIYLWSGGPYLKVGCVSLTSEQLMIKFPLIMFLKP